MPEYTRRELSRDPPVFVSTRTTGPSVLVIGDSFTVSYFPRMLAYNAARAAWMANLGCTFDWALIVELHPDEVWFMPTERFMLCKLGVHPGGLSTPIADRAEIN